MASSVVHRIYWKVDKSNFFRSILQWEICQKSASCSKLGGSRMMSSSSRTTGSSRMSPWLILPPASKGGDTVYKYYSLAEKKVLSFNKRIAESRAELVGSSHGWIALVDRHKRSVVLSNPLTGRRIELPFGYSLPYDSFRGIVSKVILSSSPDDERCRAMMTFGPANRLAFCSPAANAKSPWTPMGDPYESIDVMEDEEITTAAWAHVNEDLVYCKRRNKFSTINPCEFELDSFDYVWHSYPNPYPYPMLNPYPFPMLETWDPWNTRWPVGAYPIEVENKNTERDDNNNNSTTTLSWVKKNKGLLQDQCVQIPHIVYAEESDQLYIALRFVMLMSPDDGTTPVDRVPLCRYRGLGGYFPSKTVGFVLLKVNLDHHPRAEIVDDLNGLAVFVGINHSFALPASDFPELNPDSIYFTDSKRIKRLYGRNDIGVFDYRNKTVVEVVSSDQIGISSPAPARLSPMWFIPETSCY